MIVLPRRFCALIVSLLVSSFLFAQTNSPSDRADSPGSDLPTGQESSAPDLRSTSRVVLIDVVVTDKKNQPVRGLSQNDFTIMENGQTQNIASFEAIDPASKSSPPRTILVIDELNTHFHDSAYLRYCLEKLLKRTGAPLGQSVELVALTDGGLRLLQSFTGDADLLLAAVANRRPAIPWRLEQGRSLASERVEISLNSLEMIAWSCQGSGSRNNIIWISPGFPVPMGKQMSPSFQRRLAASIRELSDQMLKARVTVYTIDPRGPAPPGKQYTVLRDSQTQLNQKDSQTPPIETKFGGDVGFVDASLESLARQTGGRALFNRNDVDAEVADSLTDGGSYYTLSYYPSNRNFDSKFRRLDVRIANADLKARTRDGYFALPEPPPTTKRDAADQLTKALLSPLNFIGIPVREAVLAPQRGNAPGQFAVAINGAALDWHHLSEGVLESNLEVGVAGFSAKGDPIQMIYQPETLTTPVPKSGRVTGTVQFSIKIPVQQHADHVRVVARDSGTGRMGSVEWVYSSAVVAQPAQVESHH